MKGLALAFLCIFLFFDSNDRLDKRNELPYNYEDVLAFKMDSVKKVVAKRKNVKNRTKWSLKRLHMLK